MIKLKTKLGHTAVSVIICSSVTLKTWRRARWKYCNFVFYSSVDEKTDINKDIKFVQKMNLDLYMISGFPNYLR